MPTKDSRRRSLAKAISWRFIAMFITMIVSFFVITDGEAKGWVMAVCIGLVDSTVKIFAYYSHERFWANLKFGVKETPEYEI